MSTAAEERVLLVDAEDRPLGTAGKLEAHRRDLRHRALSVLLFDAAGRQLLQRRAAGKYHSPGLWSNACCSHPRPEEAPAEAAERRLFEELGVTCRLRPVAVTAYRRPVPLDLFENEIVHVFAGRCDGPLRPDPAEVAEVAWVEPAALKADVAAWPERYTVWFRLYATAPWFAAAPGPSVPSS